MALDKNPLAGQTADLGPSPFMQAMEEWAQNVLCISRGFRRVVDGVEIFDTEARGRFDEEIRRAHARNEARLAREREFGVPAHELFLRMEANRKFAEQEERREKAAERRLDRRLRRREERKRALRLIEAGERGDGRPRRACTLGKNYKV